MGSCHGDRTCRADGDAVAAAGANFKIQRRQRAATGEAEADGAGVEQASRQVMQETPRRARQACVIAAPGGGGIRPAASP
jgi:hypothetical protein